MKELLNDNEDDALNSAMDNYVQNTKFGESSENNYKEKFNKFPSNLLYAMQNTKKEILHNKLVAKTRLLEIKKGRDISARFKDEISDFFH